MESAPVAIFPGVLVLLAIGACVLLGIPLLVVLLVSPKTRAGMMSVLAFLGWGAGCLLLLSWFGWFIALPRPQSPAPPRMIEHVIVDRPSPEIAGPQTNHVPTQDVPTSVRETAVRETVVRVPTSSTASERAGFTTQPLSGERPEWLDRAPGMQDQTYLVAVKSGLWSSGAECQEALDGAIARSVQQYLAGFLGDDRAAAQIEIEPAYLRQRLVKQPVYAETVEASVGPMHEWHALLEFDQDLRSDLRRMWDASKVSLRLRYAACGFGAVIAALGTLLAQLKLDLATRGMYRRRLRWGSGLAILLVTAGAVGICVLSRSCGGKRSDGKGPPAPSVASGVSVAVVLRSHVAHCRIGSLAGRSRPRRRRRRLARVDRPLRRAAVGLRPGPDWPAGRQRRRGPGNLPGLSDQFAELRSGACAGELPVLDRGPQADRSFAARGPAPTLPLAAPTSSGSWQPPARLHGASSLLRGAERRDLEENALVTALAELIDRLRERGDWNKLACLELVFVRGWGNKEAAGELDLGEQAVANFKFEFLERLRTLVRRQQPSADVFPELYETP